MSDNCEMCANYDYNYEADCYECAMQLDEDEMSDFLAHSTQNCPYFRLYDEYKIVRKQN